MIFALFVAETRCAGLPNDPAHDFLFLDYETYPAFEDDSRREPWMVFQRVAGQISFPAGKWWGRQGFGVFKSTYFDKAVRYQGAKLNDGPLQRYWLSGGLSLTDTPRGGSSALVGVGMNSDMADFGWMDWNTEWIYTRSFVVNASFRWGMGLDIQQYFDKFMPYPLVFFDWRPLPTLRLVWDADYGEIRRYFGPDFSLAAGVRLNLEFFALRQDAGYEYNSMGLETGAQYALGRNFYMRLKYKEIVGGQQTLTLPDGSEHHEWIGSGRSLRFNLAYGI